ncbi:MAG: hypothetical protein ACR2GD_10045 [Pyrinomonadaceae bacterium]
MSTTLLSNKTNTSIFGSLKRKRRPNNFVFGKKMGLAAKLFGCWHDDLSRPFTHGKIAYRSCLKCGARKQFNPETLETYGSFYFPPVVTEGKNLVS